MPEIVGQLVVARLLQRPMRLRDLRLEFQDTIGLRCRIGKARELQGLLDMRSELGAQSFELGRVLQ